MQALVDGKATLFLFRIQHWVEIPQKTTDIPQKGE